MRNIFFPHYLSGEPFFPHYLSGEPFFPHYLSGEPLFIGLAVFKQKHNMHKQKKETLESVSLYACRGSNPGPSD